MSLPTMTGSFHIRRLSGLGITALTLCTAGALSACDRQEERLDRLEDISAGVGEQVNELDEPKNEETGENDDT